MSNVGTGAKGTKDANIQTLEQVSASGVGLSKPEELHYAEVEHVTNNDLSLDECKNTPFEETASEIYNEQVKTTLESSSESQSEPNRHCERDPVDPVTGAMFFDATDFTFPGPLPLVWSRSWYSDSKLVGHLGHGMRSSYEVGLVDLENVPFLRVYLADGRVAAFPKLASGEEHFNSKESLKLKNEGTHYQLIDPSSRLSYLLYPSAGGYMPYKLSVICNPQGHKISFDYNENGYLSHITDSVGRKFLVTTNENGRITQISFGNQALVQ